MDIFFLYVLLFVPRLWAGVFGRVWIALLVFICAIGGVCFGVVFFGGSLCVV